MGGWVAGADGQQHIVCNEALCVSRRRAKVHDERLAFAVDEALPLGLALGLHSLPYLFASQAKASHLVGCSGVMREVANALTNHR